MARKRSAAQAPEPQTPSETADPDKQPMPATGLNEADFESKVAVLGGTLTEHPYRQTLFHGQIPFHMPAGLSCKNRALLESLSFEQRIRRQQVMLGTGSVNCTDTKERGRRRNSTTHSRPSR